MSQTALGCCFGPLALHAANTVVVREGAALMAFRSAPPPEGARALFRRIADSVCVGGLPLAWLETAGGRGGFFRGDLIAVGEDDVRAMTRAILARLPALHRAWAHGAEVYAAVIRVVLAHEIGHAVQAKLGTVRHGPRAEQEADLTAGWIAEALGWPAQGDAIVLEAAGAPPTSGSHPTPAARVAAYHEGRRRRRMRCAA
jgi:hypothetical protein